MARGVLGAAFSLLLLASITQGLQQDVDILHYEKMEAVVGENVTLPCIIQSSPSLTIVSVEWRKNKSGNTKLAVYSPNLGLWKVWPNVTMQNVPNGSYLHLHDVETWDSGFYICEIATFPLGAIRSETELKIKDEVKLLCDAESIVEVPPGENVTISCTAFPADHYKWTKNNTLVSESESLELWLVTEAHSGIYTLTVNTGNKSVHKRFSITVLTATTSLRTDLMTAPPQSNVTEEGLITSLTTRRPNIDGNETKNESMGGNPVVTPTPNTGNTTVVIEDGDFGGLQSDVLLALIIVPILLLIVLVGILYRRKIKRERMALPPPFKPPPPPIKYTAARRHDIYTGPLPTSRCNSVIEPKDMKQMFLDI
ncbi:hypothetical protein CgunFtcFv8_002725 [Champsocephalus gunnari]|uniref:Ig-like domain-containing protein n=1 Tax=Champsocephalus gunnari TaxID=52237 RepID=A0AAN8D9H9_CHAGU|nr:hypothetical protein CgunFtcFv8_002725 [Champsocephalus gunnari]